jgi:photosystem II stability/assembly factor-like uncharacterized protein
MFKPLTIIENGTLFAIINKNSNLIPMKKATLRLASLCGFLFLMQLMTFCTKNDSLETENEPNIDGWEIKSINFDINVHTTKLLFINPSTGYIIGYNGAMLITKDSGNTWQFLSSGTTLHLNSAFFLDENTGFISGRGMSGCLDPDCDKGSIFLRTTDGGYHWDKIFYDSLAYLKSMQFRDPEHGIAVMEYYQRPNEKHMFLVKTDNSGTTWSKTDIDIPQTTPATLINVQDIYYLIGENHKILKSTNFGNSWQSYATPITASNDIQDMYFINKDIGFISDGVYCYKTTNGAATWQKIDNQTPWLHSVHFYNDLEGFGFKMVAKYEGGDFPTFKGTYIYTTNDGGVTWSHSDLFSKFVIGYPSFPNPTIGYALNGSTLYRFIKK